MKELILFSFVVVFISCQNQPLPETVLKFGASKASSSTIMESTNAPEVEVLICESTDQISQPKFDLLEAIHNEETPGIYYREVVLRTNQATLADAATLICVSQVSELPEEQTEQMNLKLSSVEGVLDSPQVSSENQWKLLTEKWYPKKTNVCQNKNANTLNPLCEPQKMLAIEPDLAPFQIAQPIASM